MNSWTRKHSAQGYRELPSKAWVVIAKEEKNQTGADSIEKEILNMSSDTDFATIMKAVVGHSPFPKKLTVKVLCSDPATTYINDKKEKRELMNTVTADSSKVVKYVWFLMKKNSQVKSWHHHYSEKHHLQARWDSCHKCNSYISCTLNPQPPTIYGEGMAILHPPC